MKKMNSQYNKLNDMFVDIQNIIFNLVEKSDDIMYKFWDKGMSMTDKEQERYDKINEQINNLVECEKYIRLAMSCLRK